MDEAAKGWTAAKVLERLSEAVDTLKRVRVPDLQRNLTRWPDVVHDAVEGMNPGPVHLKRGPATPDAISRMDESLLWLRWLERDAQRLVWGRIEGASWRTLAHFVGASPNTCRAHFTHHLLTIAARLNGVRAPALQHAA